MNHVHDFYNRLESAIRTATERIGTNYATVFSSNNKPLSRQERWEWLRQLRTDDNETRARFYSDELVALSQAFEGIGEHFVLARADMATIDLPGCEPGTASHVACELMQSVITWHESDGGYWETAPRAESDQEAREARQALQASDANYPLTKAMADTLRTALHVERSHVLRQVKNLREEGNKPIPPEKRSRPMSKAEALIFIGWPKHCQNERQATDWLTRSIEDGEYRCEKLNRKTYVWHIDDFPVEAQKEIAKL